MNNRRENLSIEEMLLISIDSALKKRMRCTFGEIVKESFTLFPGVFALSQFPDWPDSLKLDRQLRKFREKGFITGSPITYYSLTKFGRKVMDKLRLKIKGKKIDSIAKKPTRNPDLAFLEMISKSEEFHNFVKNKKNYKPSNMRIREITKFTLETPNEIVSNFLHHLSEIAKKRKKKDLVEFLVLYEEFITRSKI